MFVKRSKSSGGRYLLSYAYGYRDENKKVRHVNYETIGYEDELAKVYDNPKEHFSKIGKERFKDFKPFDDIDTLTINLNKRLDSNDNSSDRFNLGYSFLKEIYNELDLKSIFQVHQKKHNMEYDLNAIFQLLVYSRVIYPGSKKATYESKDSFFENFDFSLKDLYRGLDHFALIKDELLSTIWDKTKDIYKRDVSTTYFDCTNYYYEITYNDTDLIDEEGNILEKGYRKKGPCKANSKNPIVSLALLMDNNGIPIDYSLFPGNESEKQTLLPLVKGMRKKFGIQKTITVADRGLNTADNCFYMSGKNDEKSSNNDGYVYGQSIRGGSKEFKEWAIDQKDFVISNVLDEKGKPIIFTKLVKNEETGKMENKKHIRQFKHKSRVISKTIKIEKDGNRNVPVQICQKQMVYYSAKYAKKQKKERELAIAKAKSLIANRGKYTKATSYGAASYIENLKFDKSTGAILDGELILKEDKIAEEEKYDGYYSIVTSEIEMDDLKLRNVYKGLWEIEETFKITKSGALQARPAYVWTKEHIEAHFLTCFIALIFLRLLEKRLGKKYSIDELTTGLRKFECVYMEQATYKTVDANSAVIKELGSIFKKNYQYVYLRYPKIKKLLNISK